MSDDLKHKLTVTFVAISGLLWCAAHYYHGTWVIG